MASDPCIWRDVGNRTSTTSTAVILMGAHSTEPPQPPPMALDLGGAHASEHPADPGRRHGLRRLLLLQRRRLVNAGPRRPGGHLDLPDPALLSVARLRARPGVAAHWPIS